MLLNCVETCCSKQNKTFFDVILCLPACVANLKVDYVSSARLLWLYFVIIIWFYFDKSLFLKGIISFVKDLLYGTCHLGFDL